MNRYYRLEQKTKERYDIVRTGQYEGTTLMVFVTKDNKHGRILTINKGVISLDRLMDSEVDLLVNE